MSRQRLVSLTKNSHESERSEKSFEITSNFLLLPKSSGLASSNRSVNACSPPQMRRPQTRLVGLQYVDSGRWIARDEHALLASSAGRARRRTPQSAPRSRRQRRDANPCRPPENVLPLFTRDDSEAALVRSLPSPVEPVRTSPRAAGRARAARERRAAGFFCRARRPQVLEKARFAREKPRKSKYPGAAFRPPGADARGTAAEGGGKSKSTLPTDQECCHSSGSDARRGVARRPRSRATPRPSRPDCSDARSREAAASRRRGRCGDRRPQSWDRG